MSKLSITKAFALYGATLRNTLWAYSAIADDGSLIISCWDRYLTQRPDGVLRYDVNDFSRWSANPSGKRLLLKHLRDAFADELPVRMVLAVTDSPKAVVAGVDARKVAKTFTVKEELVGKVVEFSEYRFIIDFRNAQA